jgi:hypothetical protein
MVANSVISMLLSAQPQCIQTYQYAFKLSRACTLRVNPRNGSDAIFILHRHGYVL